MMTANFSRIFSLLTCLLILFLPARADTPSGGEIQRLIQKSTSAHEQVADTTSPGQAPPIVMGVQFHTIAESTRFEIEVSRPVQVRTFALSAPNRLVIDMPPVAWKLTRAPRPTGKGLIHGYRYGQFRPTVSRFVLDLNAPVKLARAVLVPPQKGFGYRIVLDLTPTTQSAFDHQAGWPSDLLAQEQKTAQRAILPRPRPAQRKIIVIDPGHGGIDDGTTGIGGMHEKNLVLPEGHLLADDLTKRGYIVHMTRTDDTFIPLGKRVAMARDWHADLFISLHANSNPDASIDGLSIYTLSDKGSDEAARMLAAKENRADIVAGVDLSGDAGNVAPILIDLAQRDSINKSSRFADIALKTLRPVTSILAHEPHRSAAFRVLKAPDMPAVLIELGFLSNRHDAARMRTKYWRKRVAQAIATAVDNYFGRDRTTTHVTRK